MVAARADTPRLPMPAEAVAAAVPRLNEQAIWSLTGVGEPLTPMLPMQPWLLPLPTEMPKLGAACKAGATRAQTSNDDAVRRALTRA